MTFTPMMAEKRFGYGLSPIIAAPKSVQEMLAGFLTVDGAKQMFPVPGFFDLTETIIAERILVKAKRNAKSTDEKTQAREALVVQRKKISKAHLRWFRSTMARRIHGQHMMRERLIAFWADHFTVQGKGGLWQFLVSPYVEDAIRPNVSERFEDLLFAAVTHPMMLMYLDQVQSVGPNSRYARKKGKARGLNENLAREVLELHTLGVDGPYGQNDVRQLAEMFTGLVFQPKKMTFRYSENLAEPGTKTVLGKTYGDLSGGLMDIYAVLQDLARHPVTAQHISRKLAVHFVSDTPDPLLVDALTRTYLDTDGNLLAVYETLLSHPAAWNPKGGNIKPPVDFVSSAFRAMAVPANRLLRMNDKNTRLTFLHPLIRMGQSWQSPLGPNGWPEEDAAWVSPQGQAARLQWAMYAPEQVLRKIPDPREFVTSALGDPAPGDVEFAAGAAENRREGVALVLMSPDFQRR